MQLILEKNIKKREVSSNKKFLFDNVSNIRKLTTTDTTHTDYLSYRLFSTLFYSDGSDYTYPYMEKIYTEGEKILNFFSNSYVDDLNTFLDANSGSATVSTNQVDITLASNNAISISGGNRFADLVKTYGTDLYYSGWHKSTAVNNSATINGYPLELTTEWKHFKFKITQETSISQIEFSTPIGTDMQIYQPRVYSKEHSLYVESGDLSEYDFMYVRVPSTLDGDTIKKNTFKMSYLDSNEIVDDGYGNLKLENEVVGNIFYEDGVIFIDNFKYFFGTKLPLSFLYDGSSYVDIEYQSSVHLQKETIQLFLNRSIYNFSTNPTYSDENVPLFFTGVGLYNEKDELIMMSKISKPIEFDDDILLVLENYSTDV